jgi:tetratricopeptide (TPR) repeat protein
LVTETDVSPDIMQCMVFAWLKARDAVDAGSELADSFPAQTTADYIREYIDRSTHQLRTRKLSFYKRVRFANAFKWRLLEKGVAAQTAHDITQTLLINMLAPGTTATPVTASTGSSLRPVNARSVDTLLQRADAAVARGSYLEAVAQYQEYTARRPKDFAGFNNLGATLTRLGRLEDARKQLHTALALNPKKRRCDVQYGQPAYGARALCGRGELLQTRRSRATDGPVDPQSTR